MAKSDGKFYDTGKLNRLFALSSLILLGSIAWMIWDDYDRPWKEHQRTFFRMEAERTRVALAEEEARIAEALAALPERRDAAQAAVDARAEELDALRSAMEGMKTRLYQVNQDLSFAKADLDALKYEYEEARQHALHERPDADPNTDPHVQEMAEAFRSLQDEVGRLRRTYEGVESERREIQAAIDAILEPVSEVEQEERRLRIERDRLARRIEELEPGLINAIRDAPLIDFAAPRVRPDQQFMRHLTVDYYFADAYRVDRCTTCHVAIDKPGYEEAEHPYRTHPRLDLYLADSSPHPLKDYGCTVCHDGAGMETHFTLAAHTPPDEATAERWAEEYGWHELHDWDYPMLPIEYVDASCRKCHEQDDTIEGADLYNEGRTLFEEVGCFNCHRTKGFTDLRKSGPSLQHLPDKVTEAWAYRWILDPESIRPTTRMPAFFGLSNNSDPESRVRNAVEVRAIVAYLFGRATPVEYAAAPPPGDAEEGGRLFRSVGCTACHVEDDPENDGAPGRDYGPNLAGIGEKTSYAWLYHWIRDPRRHFPESRMPSLRITEEEGSHIAAYLASRTAEEPSDEIPVFEGDRLVELQRLVAEDLLQASRLPGAESLDPAAARALVESLDPDELLDRYVEALVVEHRMSRELEADARRETAAMSPENRLQYVGERAISQYGCYACHEIPGAEDRIAERGKDPFATGLGFGRDFTGTEAIGDKNLARVDFGFQHDIPHTWYDWIEAKLDTPRVFDVGFERRHAERLRMPRFNLTEEEREALVSWVLSITNERIPSEYRHHHDAREAAIHRGEGLIRDRNCASCHQFEHDRIVVTADAGRTRRTVAGTVQGFEQVDETDRILYFRPLETVTVGDRTFERGVDIELEPDDWVDWIRPRGSAQDAFLRFMAEREGAEPVDPEALASDDPFERAEAEAAWRRFRNEPAHLQMLPPLLAGQGGRTQPEWLYRFLQDPIPLRLQLDLRMPTFHLSEEEARTLVEYFAASAEAPYPYAETPETEPGYIEAHREGIEHGRIAMGPEQADCWRCHVQDGQPPAGQAPENWGPDLDRVHERLQPDWIVQWIARPSLLMPGTPMPDFEDQLSLEDREAIKDFLMNLPRMGEE